MDQKSTFIKPTIGRVVLYQPPRINEGTLMVASRLEQPWPATICYVHGDGQINVAGTRSGGTHFCDNHIPLVQEGEMMPPTGAYAYWMDYQLGQAARTEAVEEKLRNQIGDRVPGTDKRMIDGVPMSLPEFLAKLIDEKFGRSQAETPKPPEGFNAQPDKPGTGPKITEAGIEGKIRHEFLFPLGVAIKAMGMPVHADVIDKLNLMTVCVLILENGFIVIGYDGCVSEEIYKQEIGQEMARENAIEQIWKLEGYALKQRLYDVPNVTGR